MTISKRILQVFLAAMLLISLFSGVMPATVSAAGTGTVNLTADEVVALISDTYSQVKSMSGRRSFYNRCSTLVNYTTVALGLQTEVYSCNGNGEYDLYEGISQTDKGYDVRQYSAKNYSLESALNAISENGTKDVYNIIVGWQSGSSYAARYYGHTCFIFAILDGYVYFYDNYNMSIGGTYYKEGAPIVCTIKQFANYYDRWARFEGAVHLVDTYQEILSADTEAPRITGLRATDLSSEGFTITCNVSDNLAMRKLQFKVWTYGQTEEDAIVIEPELIDGDIEIRINTADFDDFVGHYYVSCTALDEAGNSIYRKLAVDLYTFNAASGTYRVLSEATGAHNAPYESVNGTDTLEYTIEPASLLTIVGSCVNDLGETWYLLEDETWVKADAVIRELQWYEVIEFINGLLVGSSENVI